MRLITILTVALLLAGQAIAKPTAGAPAVCGKTHQTTSMGAATPRNDIPGLKNFAWVSPGLCRGAQPTDKGFAELKEMHVRTIVNLRMFHSDGDLIENMDLQCIRIHCTPLQLTDAQIAMFLKIVDDPRNQPVFVHCQHGADRTGTVVAAYRILREGWSPDAAIAEMKTFGWHNVFTPLIRYLSDIQKASPGTGWIRNDKRQVKSTAN